MAYTFETAYIVVTGSHGLFEVDQICETKELANAEMRDLKEMGCTVNILELPLTFADDFCDRFHDGDKLSMKGLKAAALQCCEDLQKDHDNGHMDESQRVEPKPFRETRYFPTLDIWALPPQARAALHPGQWVSAGPNGARGQYLGQTRGGSDVVAWVDNAKGRRVSYTKALRQYALGK